MDELFLRLIRAAKLASRSSHESFLELRYRGMDPIFCRCLDKAYLAADQKLYKKKFMRMVAIKLVFFLVLDRF